MSFWARARALRVERCWLCGWPRLVYRFKGPPSRPAPPRPSEEREAADRANDRTREQTERWGSR